MTADKKNVVFDNKLSLRELKRRSISGTMVTTSSRLLLLALNVGSTMILARLLVPGDFGIVAMVVVYTGFAALFQEAGLSAATIQKEELKQTELSTIFWLNLLVSLLVTLIVAASAPLLARIYNQPLVVDVTLWLSLEFLIAGLGMQHLALLRRQMRFSALAVIEVAAFLCGALAGIAWAMTEPSLWALVAFTLTRATAKSIFAWLLSQWRPGPPTSLQEIIPMVKFGANLTGFNAINYFSSNLDSFLVGRYWGAEALGFYSRAFQLLELPLGQVNRPIAQVAVPALSRLQADPVEYRKYYYRAMESIAAIGKPLVAFLFVCAEPIILLVLGDNWGKAAPIFQAIAFGAYLGVSNVAAGWVYLTLGRTGRQLRFEAATLPVKVICIAVGAMWGPVGAAAGVSLSRGLLYIPLRLWAFHNSPISLSGFLRSIGRATVASLAAGVCAWYAMQTVLLSESNIEKILWSAAIGGSVYLCVYLILPGGRAFLGSSYSAVYSTLAKGRSN